MNCKTPKEGDTRVIKRFCLFPRTINNNKYWLERITIKQEYRSMICYVAPGDRWVDIKVIDE